MQTTKPEDFRMLLTVCYNGLINGIITRHEVVAWADEIIKSEPEPDYFFIEISLCANINELIEIIGQKALRDYNKIQIRVLFGVCYQKLSARLIDIKSIYRLIGNIFYRDHLFNPYESSCLYKLDDM